MKGIETALWNYSIPELNAQVEGLIHFPFINFAGVTENGKLITSAGEPKVSGVFEENIPLSYTYDNHVTLPFRLGNWLLQVDKNAIMSEALNQCRQNLHLSGAYCPDGIGVFSCS